MPWRGYFDIIHDVDLFLLADNLQYTKRNWRNRNRFKTTQGTVWMTVPVRHDHLTQSIDETYIDYSQPWQEKAAGLLEHSYARSPHFERYYGEVSAILAARHPTISELNLSLIRWVCSLLGIKTPIRYMREFSPEGGKTERAVDVLRKAGATTYLSGPAAKDYIVPERFTEAGIKAGIQGVQLSRIPSAPPPLRSVRECPGPAVHDRRRRPRLHLGLHRGYGQGI